MPVFSSCTLRRCFGTYAYGARKRVSQLQQVLKPSRGVSLILTFMAGVAWTCLTQVLKKMYYAPEGERLLRESLLIRRLRVSPLFFDNDNVTDNREAIPSILHDNFCVVYNLTRGENNFNDDGLEPISFALHSTSQYLGLIGEQVKRYDGPLSLALYADKNSALAIDYLHALYRCDDEFREKLSIHVVWTRSAYQEECPSLRVNTAIACENFTIAMRKQMRTEMVHPFGIYPINVMRNVARLGASTQLYFVADVENIPSENFHANIKEVAQEHLIKKRNHVLAVRRFEIADKKPVPKNAAELRKMTLEGTAFQFHHKHFPQGHSIPDLPKWFNASVKKTATAFELPYKGPLWEPQFIAHSSMPLAIESLPTRHRDGQALAYELCRANYTFWLASHVFTVHPGIKIKVSSMDDVVQKYGKSQKKTELQKFRTLMDQRYGNQTGRCKQFVM